MLQWFKRHPDFLRKESSALASNSNYKEIAQERRNIFLSHGEIIVRLNTKYAYPILVVYLDSTPYSLPEIYPLQRKLSKQEVKEFSELNHFELYKRVLPLVEFYYSLRHQNASGSLCILEWDNLDDGSKFFGISTILKRVRDWYVGHVTGNFPLDNQEIELFAHFKAINTNIVLVYPEEFLDSTMIEGDFYASLASVTPRLKNPEQKRYVYSGVLLDGFTKAGIAANASTDLRYNLHPQLRKTADIYTNPDIVKQLIDSKSLLKASWFHLTSTPRPFQNFSDFITTIGNGDYSVGVVRFNKIIGQSLNADPDSFYVALRFASRSNTYELILLQVYKRTNPPVIDFAPEKRFQSILDRYDKIEAIECEKVTKESFHQRNSIRARVDVLSEKVINILGAGAIGSELADSLSKAGFGTLVLVDNQSLRANNTVRHLAGIEYIGQAKVDAVRRIVESHNPFIRTISFEDNLYWLNPNLHLSRYSLSVSSTADDNLEGYINEKLVISNHPCFYVRALRGGKVGRIFRVIPGQDACFHCLNLYRQQKQEFIEIPLDPDYPTLKNECNNPIRPASAADLKLIAALASQLVIGFAQGNNSESNHWLWTTESIPQTPLTGPFQVYSQTIKIHPDCTYCNSPPKAVSIQGACLTFMQSLVKQNPNVETGGVLAGIISPQGNVEITDVSGPGPKAKLGADKFEKDIEYCQIFLDSLYINSGKKVVYVGEWHSHPSDDNRPSGLDIESLTAIANQKEYLTVEPVSIILSKTGEPSCTMHPSGSRYYMTELKII
jgi:integrative and conjugative element protein (TIGR02256 family)